MTRTVIPNAFVVSPKIKAKKNETFLIP